MARTFAVVVLGLVVPTWAAAGEFIYGDIYVTISEPEGCDGAIHGFREAIVRVRPTCGAADIVATNSDGICYPSGLAFGPSNRSLFALNGGSLEDTGDLGYVLECSAAGCGETILDASDGLVRPNRGITFDSQGRLYVVNDDSRILRFSADLSTSEVVASEADGINDRGALAFAPNGDLLYAGELGGAILRITPAGVVSTFDLLDNPSDIDVDRAGNIYVATTPGTIYLYPLGQLPRIPLAEFAGFGSSPNALTISPDGSALYFIEPELSANTGGLYRIPLDGGAPELLWDTSELGYSIPFGLGMAVFAPEVAGDVHIDGRVDAEDHSCLARCWTGPGVVAWNSCEAADVDDDSTVGLRDFATVQANYGFEDYSSDCGSEHPTAGCRDPLVEECVCSQIAYCCVTSWDTDCVAAAQDGSCAICE